jgi:hypothetical protein
MEGPKSSPAATRAVEALLLSTAIDGQYGGRPVNYAAQPFRQPPARNAPCPCGSGKKWKRCCRLPKPKPPRAT